LTVDGAAKTASLRVLNFSATQNHQPLMRATLSTPMNLSWSGENVSGDSALAINVSGLNLTDGAVLGPAISSGDFNLDAKLSSQSGGKQLALSLDPKSQISPFILAAIK